MEKEFNYKEYRDNLAKELRSNNREERKEILEKAKETEEYRTARNIHLKNATKRRFFLVEQGLDKEVHVFDKIVKIAEFIKESGGIAFSVGGSVRDEIMGIPPKDYDIEVFGLERDQLEKLVSKHGKVNNVGKSYNVIKLTIGDSEIDISVSNKQDNDPETESDLNTSIKQSMSCRDFTINAIYKDILTGQIIDHYNGVDDINNKILKITNLQEFKKDPLRVLRGIQFASRFNLKIDENSEKEMMNMINEVKEISKERIKDEWIKILLKSEKPSKGLRLAKKWGILKEIYPEIDKLQTIPQDKEWHPEGDVWEHTLLTVDAMRKIIEEEKLSQQENVLLILTALCHDLGKITTTKEVDGKIKTINHEQAGEELTRKLLLKMGIQEKLLIKKVSNLVGQHLKPLTFYTSFKQGQNITDGAFRKLAGKIHPATMKQLMLVSKADFYGRGCPTDETFFIQGDWFMDRVNKLSIQDMKAENIIKGKDLEKLGFKPGPLYSKIIELANEMDVQGYSKEEIMSEIKIKFTGEDNEK